MRLESVTDFIFVIRGQERPSFPPCHSILIDDEDVVIIDTGCGTDILDRIRHEFDVSYVINSHTHPDHSAGNWTLADKPVWVPKQGFDVSGDMNAIAERFSNPGVADLWCDYMERVWGFRECRPTHSYDESLIFDFGHTRLVPVHSPGHSDDHYCFLEPEAGVLLSFDYDLTSFPWYGHYESSLVQFCESLEHLRALRPRVVVSSHRGVVDGDLEAEFCTYRQVIEDRSRRILRLLDDGKTLDQLVNMKPIYGSFPYMEPVLRFWEGRMIEEHLNQLIREGMVERVGDMYCPV